MDHDKFTADMERIRVASSDAATRLAEARTTAEWDDAYRDVADTDRQLLALAWGLLNRIGIPCPPNISERLRIASMEAVPG